MLIIESYNEFNILNDFKKYGFEVDGKSIKFAKEKFKIEPSYDEAYLKLEFGMVASIETLDLMNDFISKGITAFKIEYHFRKDIIKLLTGKIKTILNSTSYKISNFHINDTLIIPFRNGTQIGNSNFYDFRYLRKLVDSLDIDGLEAEINDFFDNYQPIIDKILSDITESNNAKIVVVTDDFDPSLYSNVKVIEDCTIVTEYIPVELKDKQVINLKISNRIKSLENLPSVVKLHLHDTIENTPSTPKEIIYNNISNIKFVPYTETKVTLSENSNFRVFLTRLNFPINNETFEVLDQVNFNTDSMTLDEWRDILKDIK